MIAFEVKGKPVQQGSMKAFNNRVVHTKGKELTAWRNKVAAAAIQAGVRPSAAPIGLTLRFTYARGKTVTRAMPTVPPDLDKQIRSILDALKGVAYLDDGQVVAINAIKTYGDEGVEVSIREYPHEK